MLIGQGHLMIFIYFTILFVCWRKFSHLEDKEAVNDSSLQYRAEHLAIAMAHTTFELLWLK